MRVYGESMLDFRACLMNSLEYILYGTGMLSFGCFSMNFKLFEKIMLGLVTCLLSKTSLFIESTCEPVVSWAYRFCSRGYSPNEHPDYPGDALTSFKGERLLFCNRTLWLLTPWLLTSWLLRGDTIGLFGESLKLTEFKVFDDRRLLKQGFSTMLN